MILARNIPPRLQDAVLAALRGLEAPEGSHLAWTPEETADYIATTLIEQGNPQRTLTLGYDGRPHPTVALFFRTCACEITKPEASA